MPYTNFDEMAGSPVFNFSIDRSTAIREATIPWDDISDLFAYLFDGVTSRTLPGFPFLRAQSMHVEALTNNEEKIANPTSSNLDADTLNEYEKAKVVVEYSTDANGDIGSSDWDSGFNTDPVPLLSHRWSSGGEFFTMDSSGFEWAINGSADGPVVQDVQLGKFIGIQNHHVTWHRVQLPPFSKIREAISCVNSQDMQLRTGTATKETLLFLGAELQRDVLTSGSLAWQLTYKFSERSVPLTESDDIPVGGWNHYYRNDSRDALKSGFYRIRTKSTQGSGGGEPVYPLYDLQRLFVQGT